MPAEALPAAARRSRCRRSRRAPGASSTVLRFGDARRPPEGLPAGRAARRRAARHAGAARAWPSSSPRPRRAASSPARSCWCRSRTRSASRSRPRATCAAATRRTAPATSTAAMPTSPRRSPRRVAGRLGRGPGGERRGRSAPRWRDALGAPMAPRTRSRALRHALLRLAYDADLVLDLHADNEAVMHLYLGTPLWPDAARPRRRARRPRGAPRRGLRRQPVRRGLQRPVVGARPPLPRGGDPARLPRRHRRAPLEQRRRRHASPRTTPRRSCASSIRRGVVAGDPGRAAARSHCDATPLDAMQQVIAPRRRASSSTAPASATACERASRRRDRRPARRPRWRSRPAPPASSSPATTSPSPGPARSSARSPAASRCRSGPASS